MFHLLITISLSSLMIIKRFYDVLSVFSSLSTDACWVSQRLDPLVNSFESHTLLSGNYAILEDMVWKRLKKHNLGRNYNKLQLLFVLLKFRWEWLFHSMRHGFSAFGEWVVTSLTITSLSSMISAVKRYWGNCIEILPSSKVTGAYRSQGRKVTEENIYPLRYLWQSCWEITFFFSACF